MPLNMEEDTPQPHMTRSKKTGVKQKNKNANQRVKPASTTRSTPGNGSEGVIEDENELIARIAKAKEELKALEVQKEAISKEITEASATTTSVPKRLVRDLLGEAGVNWELPWSEVSAVKKAKLYQTAREEAPFLKKFANDWPTQMLAMQLMKNKRGHSYHRGYLEPRENGKGGGHRASVTPQLGEEETNDDSEPTDMSAVTLGSTLKRAAPVTAAAQQPRRKKPKTTAGAANTHSKGKAKQRASPIEDEDEDEDKDVDETPDSDDLEVDMVDLEEHNDLWVKINLKRVLKVIQRNLGRYDDYHPMIQNDYHPMIGHYLHPKIGTDIHPTVKADFQSN
ncbi:hypothetical protein BJY52DRAFT_1226577 [Lactarius psammicola]|nr:hypothetical protein BJY52DRAFT_1226577 [Lactarius psammicola]